MKKIWILICFIIALSFNSLFAQSNYFLDQPDTTKLGGMAFIGAVTVDGENYQQLGVRADIPIWKIGLGIDFQLLFDNEGHIREEDWDEWTDYLDKLYYIRFGRKGDPFYIRAGGLDFTNIGYRNVVNGYTNMIEYPTVKRWGMEMEINKENHGVELFLNDYKEIFEDKASFVYGLRGNYKVFGKLEIGATIAGDLNEYNALKDNDGDGYPNEIDYFPDNKDWATEYDKFYSQTDGDSAYIRQSIDYGILTDTTKSEDLFNKHDDRSSSFLMSIDIGYPLIEKENLTLDVYSHFTKINNYGWGVTFPGARFGIRNFLYLTAELRKQSKEFLYGYLNNTYELERAIFTTKGDSVEVLTKKESLKGITEDLNGFFAGAEVRLANLIHGGIYYQDMMGDSINRRSIRGEIGLREGLIPNLTQAKAYYIQNNVQDFREWKTPSTILGAIIEYSIKSAAIGFEYRYTFQDVNGDGKIRGSDETFKTFGFRTSMRF